MVTLSDGPPPATQRGRIPPQDVDAERSVLGAMLLESNAVSEAAQLLTPDDFYRPAHGRVFESMLALFDRGDPIDEVTVRAQLSAEAKLDAVGGAAFIAGLTESVPTAANVSYYARIVRNRALSRKLIAAATAIAGAGYEGGAQIEELLDQAEAKIFEITSDRDQRSFTPLKEVVKGAFKEIEKRYERKEMITGVPTGFVDFDKKTAGLQPSDLIIVAGRPSMGKTALALNMAQNAAVRSKTAVALFSLEMSKEQLVMRMLCSEARIDSHRLRGGFLKDSDWPKLARAAGQLAEAAIYIDDTGSISILEMRAKARRLQAEKGLGLIVVDYLQLMRGRSSSEGREREISEISRGLKALAKELAIPVVALSQLNRSLEQRQDKRPMLSDLRECVTGDTLVLQADGTRTPIQDLVGQTPEVLAMNAEGRIVSAEADAVWSVGRRDVFSLRLASGRELRATAKHRVFTGEGWQQLGDVMTGDRVAIARSVPAVPASERWPDSRVALLGQLIGDGSYLSGQPLRYTTKSEENARAVEGGARELGSTVKRYAGRRTWFQLLIGGNGNRWHPAGVNAWLKDLGIFNQRSHEKRIPSAVFGLEKGQIATLLRHLWATDGSIWVAKDRSRGRIYYSTNSRGLAFDVAALLLRLGIVGRIKTVHQGRHRDAFHVDVSGAADQRLFLDGVGAFGPRVRGARALANVLANRHRNTSVDTLPIEIFDEVKSRMGELGISQRQMAAMRGTSYGGTSHFAFAPSRQVVSEYAELLDHGALKRAAESDLFWDRVVSVEPAGSEEVFDLTVPGPASWLADGVVSHNSGAIEQDADVICFVYRDEYYNPESDNKGISELIVGKQRNGPTGTVELRFFNEFTRFENLSPEG